MKDASLIFPSEGPESITGVGGINQNCAVAPLLLPFVPSVARVTFVLCAPSLKCQTAVAVTVIAAALLFVKINVQDAVLPTCVGLPHVLVENELGVDGE